jgi:hypothetical protein
VNVKKLMIFRELSSFLFVTFLEINGIINVGIANEVNKINGGTVPKLGIIKDPTIIPNIP